MGSFAYDFTAVSCSVFNCSCNRTLNHSEMSHNVAEQRDVERLEQSTDNSSNSQEMFVEEWQFCF